MSDQNSSITVDEVTTVAPPPRARVEDAEPAAETFARKRDYLAGFLAEKPAEQTATTPGGSTYDAIIDALVPIRGIGRWTAEMFLMFRLHRPDVLPGGDLGIVVAIQRLYKLRKRPDAKRVLKIGEAWRPYRSVASWYLGQTLKSEPLQTKNSKLKT